MTIDRIGIEMLSVFGLAPVAFVDLAADLGCRSISTGLGPAPINPHGFAPFSLRDDAALRGEMLSAMHDRGVAIGLGEGLNVRAGSDVADLAPDLDAMAALEVRRVNTVSLDPDLGRSFDQFGRLCELAAARGMETVIEFAPGLVVGDLATALAAITHVGRPDFRLLIDTMHFGRTGGTPEVLAALDPDLIGYVQLSDVPLVPTETNYMAEAMTDRRVPGEGELPLLAILAEVPRDCVVSLEIPMLAKAKAGLDAAARLGPAVEATRRLLIEIEAARD